MKKPIEKIIGGLKNDPSYRLDSSLSARQLIYVVWYRAWQLFRGFLLKIKIHSSGLVFCGRGANVQHGYQFTSGGSLIIEEGVQINALSDNGITVGDRVTIGKNAILSCTGVIANKGVGIRIGNNSAIGAQSYLGGQGGITIGNDVILGPHVKIFSENHNYKDPGELIRRQGESRKGVVINDNCWIGAGVIIVDGVTIGSGCVIAAGAIVTKSIPEGSMALGVPAKVAGPRTQMND